MSDVDMQDQLLTGTGCDVRNTTGCRQVPVYYPRPDMCNGTMYCMGPSDVDGDRPPPPPPEIFVVWDSWNIIFTCFNLLVFTVGMIGNGLVIFVVLRYAKMKTVTNMYIVNLAVADLCVILTGTPITLTTSLVRTWVFGFIICKVYYVVSSLNKFTSVFTLTVMSADRYVAVCHPIRSINYRTPVVSRVVCICVWSLSLLAMMPLFLYATTYTDPDGYTSCIIDWPAENAQTASRAFLIYGFCLGFAIPVATISVFYTLVVVRLKKVGPKRKSREKKRSHRKVTKLVLIVIAVYVVCWLPYWAYQVIMLFLTVPHHITVFRVFTLLKFSNSMLNPVLYAFLSDNFRQSFIKAFKCASRTDVNRLLQVEQTVLSQARKNHNGNGASPMVSKSTKSTRVDDIHYLGDEDGAGCHGDIEEDEASHCINNHHEKISTYDVITAPADCADSGDTKAMVTQL